MTKTVLITGTSSGVGLESTILFAKQGYKVYATMRNLKKADALRERIAAENVSVEILSLDVTDTESIRSAVQTILDTDGRINILVNNAGAGFAKTTEQATEDEIRWVTNVNYLGVVYCTKAVLPAMRKQKTGHIINITSVGGLVGQPFNELYCGAKFAVEGYTEALATYISDPFSIKLTCIEPGGISTEFMKSAIEKTTEDGQMATGEYKAIFEQYATGIQKRAASGENQVYQTPQEIAKIILDVATSDNPPLRLRTSEWAEQFTTLKTQADPNGSKIVEQVRSGFL